jgi:flagellar biosynthesis/type III secretory pathway protein FliH
MPITEDILKHPIIGPAYWRAFEEGYKAGYEEGYKEGELAMLRRLLTKRFGPIPAWLEERLMHSSTSDLEEFCDEFLDAQNLEDLKK